MMNLGRKDMMLKEKEKYIKNLKLFNSILENVDSMLHKVDVIDYYEIVGEKIDEEAYSYARFIGKNYSPQLAAFMTKNTMFKEFTLNELLNPNNGYGVIMNKKRYFASEAELVHIYEQLKERKIPVCQKTVTAQLRRNVGLNTDYHYPDLPLQENKTKKLIK